MDEKILKKYAKKLILPIKPLYPDNELCVGFYVDDPIPIAKGYERVVIGERGPYIEFNTNQLQWPDTRLYVPEDQMWRFQANWENVIFYHEYRTVKGNIMVYRQTRAVNYADYKVDMWYISPWDLTSDQYPMLIKGNKPKHVK